MKLIASVVLASALLAGSAHSDANTAEYQVTNLPSLGGTISRGNSIASLVSFSRR